jgi:hypothetical protein
MTTQPPRHKSCECNKSSVILSGARRDVAFSEEASPSEVEGPCLFSRQRPRRESAYISNAPAPAFRDDALLSSPRFRLSHTGPSTPARPAATIRPPATLASAQDDGTQRGAPFPSFPSCTWERTCRDNFVASPVRENTTAAQKDRPSNGLSNRVPKYNLGTRKRQPSRKKTSVILSGARLDVAFSAKAGPSEVEGPCLFSRRRPRRESAYISKAPAPAYRDDALPSSPRFRLSHTGPSTPARPATTIKPPATLASAQDDGTKRGAPSQGLPTKPLASGEELP